MQYFVKVLFFNWGKVFDDDNEDILLEKGYKILVIYLYKGSILVRGSGNIVSYFNIQKVSKIVQYFGLVIES